MVRIAGIERCSVVDGPGVRDVVYFSGCTHACDGCHSKDLQNPDYGREIELNALMDEVKENIEFIDGITLSGGDPLFQLEDVLTFMVKFKTHYPDKTIMVYTGSLLDYVDKQILEYANYLMDGKYEKNNPTKKRWRGSDNQIMWIREKWDEWTHEDYYEGDMMKGDKE